MIENALAGIVITAQSFNPSIFSETWLDRNDVLTVEDLEGTRIFSPEVTQFQTKKVQILIVPPKIQISFKMNEPDIDFKTPRKIPIRIIELLPHTPFQALGLNFDFFIKPPNGQDISSYSRSLLGTGDYKLISEFSDKDARFGRYFSKNFGESRLRLDIKPVKAGPENKDLLLYSFNFHYDVTQMDPSARGQKIIEHIKNWDSLKEYSATLLKIGAEI